ncbi:hypothetical protein BOTBODRAFT_166781 [Botryobasidium botryosum FD-172 SS1]|uniref:Probable methionine--tRNA ligase, mitochondrial n=1 Tax=Botryobasidium botryosum (strain FD-172 SS1) TaxID=930990 RepID=A0A067LZB5_BOTB1|nr:hypothetical protein BOTBODRAFT_166781 [Botryobasidium botryosum FD-172 SS1]
MSLPLARHACRQLARAPTRRTRATLHPTHPPSSIHQSARFLSTATPTTAVKPYLITTPIFYVNASPHIGHLYSTVISDVLARYARLRHPERPVMFCTGTDEHGLKIQQAAEESGKDPKEFCDLISTRFKELARAGTISNTRFIRTTDKSHVKAVQYLWRKLRARGFIYKGSHSGWYAVSDECFYTDAQIRTTVDPVTKKETKVSLETGKQVEWTEEENYKFRLSAFREPLISWLQSNPTAIYPPKRHAEVLASLTSGPLADLSVSRLRSRLSWGIEVPEDPEHTIYVWLDALINYMTFAGYPWHDGQSDGKGWPPDIMTVGKDIIRFHAVYFPAFLLALDYELPKTILAHAHWTMDRSKMSKSLGNVADPFQSIEHYGVDGVRYYLMRAGGSFTDDSDWSSEQVTKHYDTHLKDLIGNLFSRIASPRLLARLEEANAVPHSQPRGTVGERDSAIHAMLVELPGKVEKRFENLEVGKALEDIMDCLAEANRHFTQLAPWAPNTPESIKSAYFYSSETLRIAGILLQPFMPTKSAELLDRMGVGEGERGWEDAGLGKGRYEGVARLEPGNPLFPKLARVSQEAQTAEGKVGKKEKVPLKVKLESLRG